VTSATTDPGSGTPVDPPRPPRRRDELISNTGAMLIGRISVAAMGWAGTLLITRTLTTAQFGQFTLVFSILGMLSIVTEMGVGRVAVNGMVDPDVDQGRFAGTYVVLRCLMGLVGYVLALAFVVVLGYPPVIVRTTAVAGLVVLLATPNHAFHLAFQASMRMGTVAVAEVVGQMAQLSLTIALVVRGGSVTWFAVPAVLAEAVILSILVPRARRQVRIRLAVLPAVWWSLLREAVPISIGTAMATLYYRVDSVMLSRLVDDEAVAVYGVAYKFVDLAHFMVIALSVPILTLLVRAWPDDPDGFRAAVSKGITLLSVCAVTMFVQILLFAPDAIGLLYGDRYVASARATRILIGAECIAWFGSLAFAVLVATGNHRRYPLVTGAGLVVNIALNLAVIPSHSYTGAAVDTLVTEILVAVPLWFLVRRIPEARGLPVRRLARLLPAGALAAGSGLAVRAVAPWPVAAVLTLVVLLTAIHVSRATGASGLRALAGRAS
jgi:O-antigen/teichoic acid export membrane protein